MRFAQVPERVSTKSFVVLIRGNSKWNHLGAQSTFKTLARETTTTSHTSVAVVAAPPVGRWLGYRIHSCATPVQSRRDPIRMWTYSTCTSRGYELRVAWRASKQHLQRWRSKKFLLESETPGGGSQKYPEVITQDWVTNTPSLTVLNPLLLL